MITDLSWKLRVIDDNVRESAASGSVNYYRLESSQFFPERNLRRAENVSRFYVRAPTRLIVQGHSRIQLKTASFLLACCCCCFSDFRLILSGRASIETSLDWLIFLGTTRLTHTMGEKHLTPRAYGYFYINLFIMSSRNRLHNVLREISELWGTGSKSTFCLLQKWSYAPRMKRILRVMKIRCLICVWKNFPCRHSNFPLSALVYVRTNTTAARFSDRFCAPPYDIQKEHTTLSDVIASSFSLKKIPLKTSPPSCEIHFFSGRKLSFSWFSSLWLFWGQKLRHWQRQPTKKNENRFRVAPLTRRNI